MKQHCTTGTESVTTGLSGQLSASAVVGEAHRDAFCCGNVHHINGTEECLWYRDIVGSHRGKVSLDGYHLITDCRHGDTQWGCVVRKTVEHMN
jgi:hypothetical protein